MIIPFYTKFETKVFSYSTSWRSIVHRFYIYIAVFWSVNVLKRVNNVKPDVIRVDRERQIIIDLFPILKDLEWSDVYITFRIPTSFPVNWFAIKISNHKISTELLIVVSKWMGKVFVYFTFIQERQYNDIQMWTYSVATNYNFLQCLPSLNYRQNIVWSTIDCL